jgi:hypothetical protein
MTTRRFLACLALVFGASVPVAADDAEIKKVAKAKANECQNALLKGDYDKFVDLTHPKVVEGNGGRKKMTDTMMAGVKELKEKGITFKSVTVHDPSDPIAGEKAMYIVIPTTLEMTVPGGRLTGKRAVLGISNDSGKTWVFVDTTPGRESLKKVFTDLPDKLPIPKNEQPTFVKD